MKHKQKLMFKKNITIIVQARLTSSRLPEKVLKKNSKRIHNRNNSSKTFSL